MRDSEVILISPQKFKQNISETDLSRQASLPWTSMPRAVTDKEHSQQIRVLPR